MYRTHEMRLVRAEDSGLEEWACPACGRRILLRWPPDYRKDVVEPGDRQACHIAGSTARPPERPTDREPAAGDEHRWAAARRRLRETGIDPEDTPPAPAPPTGPPNAPVNPSEPV